MKKMIGKMPKPKPVMDKVLDRNIGITVKPKVMSKSAAAKKAIAGKDMGKKNVPGKTGFKAVTAKATKEYGSSAAGKKVAGAVFQKMRKAGKL